MQELVYGEAAEITLPPTGRFLLKLKSVSYQIINLSLLGRGGVCLSSALFSTLLVVYF